jgi:hypothetical protein
MDQQLASLLDGYGVLAGIECGFYTVLAGTDGCGVLAYLFVGKTE